MSHPREPPGEDLINVGFEYQGRPPADHGPAPLEKFSERDGGVADVALEQA